MKYNFLNIFLLVFLMLNASFCKAKNSKLLKDETQHNDSGYHSFKEHKNHDTVMVSDTVQPDADTFFVRISNLSKVKKMDGELSSNPTKPQHLSYILLKEPSKEFKYYWIQVGVNGPVRFETLFNFHINSKTKEIYYYDALEDKRIPVKQWEKYEITRNIISF